MQGFIITVEVLALSGAALVTFLLLRRYAAQRRSEIDAQIQRLEQLHGALIEGQARHHEHIEQFVLGAQARSHGHLVRAIDDRLRGGIDAQREHLDELLRSRAEALTSQVSELLRANAEGTRQTEEQFRHAIEEKIQTGLRGATQQVEVIRRDLADLAQRVAPVPVGPAATQAPSKTQLNRAPQIVLGAEESPLVQITALASANDRAASSFPVPVTESIRRELGPALGHAARALAGGAQAAQRHMKMVFSP